MNLDILAEVHRAERLIRPYILHTPLVPSAVLGDAAGTPVWAKLENRQHTESFKLRGALSALLSLPPAARSRGVVAASSGNHGAAVAYGARLLGVPALIFVPTDAAPAKIEKIRAYGADVRAYGDDSLLAEVAARAHAAAQGLAYLSPYNDPHVIGGQGTIGLELLRDLPDLDAVYVAVGGGGLIAGIAAALKDAKPAIQVIGCSPDRSAAMIASVAAGRIVEVAHAPTISDGTAGGIEPGAITFPACRDLVDRYLALPEEEIVAAMRLFMGDTRARVPGEPIEGAAGVAIAGLLRDRDLLRGSRVAVVICGGNIDPALAAAIREGLATDGRFAGK